MNIRVISNCSIVYVEPKVNPLALVTKLTGDGHLFLKEFRGQDRVNFLRNRMRAKEFAAVERVVAKAEANGTIGMVTRLDNGKIISKATRLG